MQMCPGRRLWSPGLFLFSVISSFAPPHAAKHHVLPHHRPQTTGPTSDGLKPPELCLNESFIHKLITMTGRQLISTGILSSVS